MADNLKELFEMTSLVNLKIITGEFKNNHNYSKITNLDLEIHCEVNLFKQTNIFVIMVSKFLDSIHRSKCNIKTKYATSVDYDRVGYRLKITMLLSELLRM